MFLILLLATVCLQRLMAQTKDYFQRPNSRRCQFDATDRKAVSRRKPFQQKSASGGDARGICFISGPQILGNGSERVTGFYEKVIKVKADVAAVLD
jgi:hypothetical protein